MKMFPYVRKTLAAALLLVLLCQSALAAENGFNAGLEIQRTEEQILITVEDSDVLAAERPTLTIPCDFSYAQVTFGGQIVASSLAGGNISFPVAAGGLYTVTRLDAPPEDPTIPVIPPVPGVPGNPDQPDQSEQPDQPGGDTWSNPFTDVAEGQWYYEAVCYVGKAGLMTGVSATEFAPDTATSRAMVWTVLARIQGVDTEGGDGPWYRKAMSWATDSGISDGTDPNGLITREQLVTMLYRMAGSPAVSDPALAAVGQYPDGSQVSAWAYEGVAWAVQTGLLEGQNGLLHPGETATRAQLAALLMRFAEAGCLG